MYWHLRCVALTLFALGCGVGALPSAAPAATITIVSADLPLVGFNDPTAAVPVGGNTGTTVGEQRLLAVQHAADIWGKILESHVVIRVDASWGALDCSPTAGFLGFAGPQGTMADFSGAEHADTWYPIALANALAGVDLVRQSNDISAQFNSEVGTTPCLTSFTWYYGLDNAASATQFDLVTTALHELAHGLGFVDFVDGNTGALLAGKIDAYSRFLFDDTLGKRWDQLTDAERAASAIHSGHLTWDGPEVTRSAGHFLGDRPTLDVQAPPSIARTYAILPAGFGPPLSLAGITSDLILVDDATGTPSDACSPLANAAQLAGKIALIDRGGCPFTLKVKTAQDAGAIAVVVVNNVAGNRITTMGGIDPSIVIPSVMISLEDGNAIKAELSAGITVSLHLDPVHLAGANDDGRVLMYAPDPVVPASSVLHWDLSALPDLLMEPNIPDGIPQNGDLTVALFRDIGWQITVPIQVEYLSAVSAETGVVIAWELGRQARQDLVGIGVQRATTPDGPYVQVTGSLLLPDVTMSYEDTAVEAGASYWYRLVLMTRSGTAEVTRPVRGTFSGALLRTALFVPGVAAARGPVEIRFRIGRPASAVELDIYDVAGRRMRHWDLGQRSRGEHRTTWDRLDAGGGRVARGICIVKLVADGAVVTQKMVLLSG